MMFYYRLLLDETMDVNEKFFTMKMIYGAQSDEYDFHHMGFDDETLPTLLSMHNFCDIDRVGNFNIIQDTSAMVYHGRKISLNLVARKCGAATDAVRVEDRSSPYVSPRE
jgi:protein O-GlcNAc transferase